MSINQKFRYIRRKCDLTQEEVGKRIGKSRQWVSSVERGLISPTYKDTIELAKIYGGTPNMFLPRKKE